jgi:hypothetical protein
LESLFFIIDATLKRLPAHGGSFSMNPIAKNMAFLHVVRRRTAIVVPLIPKSLL